MLLPALAAGCVLKGAPPDDTDFGEVRRIEDLEGVYRNLGEQDADNVRPVYLSRILWPGDDALDHAAVATVEVRKEAPRVLRVRAATAVGTVLREGLYEQGRDFDLKHGRIVLKQRPSLPGADVPILGLAYEREEIGLDATGQGKARQGTAVVGLVFLFMPVAMAITEDIRFVRVAP